MSFLDADLWGEGRVKNGPVDIKCSFVLFQTKKFGYMVKMCHMVGRNEAIGAIVSSSYLG